MTDQSVRTKWGRSKFGAGNVPALAIAIPAGALFGATGGWVAILSGISSAHPVIGFLAFAICLTMPGIALAFVLVIDRNSLEGATENPDQSIESGWYDKAASGSFTDLLLGLGVASTFLAFLPMDFAVDLTIVLPAVLLACFLSFGIRYLILKHKG